MQKLKVDKDTKTADFEILDNNETKEIHRLVNLLAKIGQRKLDRYKRSNTPVPKHELERQARYKNLPKIIKQGPIKLTINNILDLEDAVNEGINEYEKKVTDNPADPVLIKLKGFKTLLHDTARSELQNRG